MAGTESSEAKPLAFTEETDYNSTPFENQEQKFVQMPVAEEVRNVKRFGVVDWVFAVVAILSMLGVLAFTIERFAYFKQHFVNVTLDSWPRNSSIAAPCNSVICTSDFTFAVVVLINLAYNAFYYFDGVVQEHQFKVLGYAIGVVVYVLYIIFDFFVDGEEGQPTRLVRLVLVCIGAVINFPLAIAVWWKMGSLAFSKVGSNKQLVRPYKLRSLFLTLQHLHYQVMLSIFVFAWTRNGEFLSIAEKVFLCLILAYLLVVMVLGWTAALYEFSVLAAVWYGLFVPVVIFYLYKIGELAIHLPTYDSTYLYYSTDGRSEIAGFHNVASVLIILCILGIVTYALLISFMIVVQRSFRKGLKNKAPPPSHTLWNRMACWRKAESMHSDE